MSEEVARALYEGGRSHALSAKLLYAAAKGYGEAQQIDDPEKFAFNGPYSLSVHYLIGLGLELMLKSAYVASGGKADDKHLRTQIGHDLLRALDLAEAAGFTSEAPRLRDIVSVMRQPYKAHYFRYSRPEEFSLPDFDEVMEMFTELDAELAAKFH